MYFIAYDMSETRKISPVFLDSWYQNYLGNKRIITERRVIDTVNDCKILECERERLFFFVEQMYFAGNVK